MSLHLKTFKLYRPLYITSRTYSEKSIYQKHEEGEKPRTVYGQLYPDWRKPWVRKEGEWNTKIGLFIEKNPNPDILYAMSQIPELSIQKIKDWWKYLKDLQEIENQKYLPERVATLGVNLAALHYFTYRLCAVKLKDSNEWIKGDFTTLDLPRSYKEGYYVEAIDCSTFIYNGIRYGGLENLSNLNFLKWLSLRNNKHIDVWCLDRIAGLCGNTLEYLDIRGCKLTSECIFALVRMKALRMLIVTDPGDDITLQAALSMLEEENPNLMINAEQPEKNAI